MAQSKCHPSYEEECGIIGIYSKKGADVAPLMYKGLIALQHRGQDAAGFAFFDGKEIDARKGIGLAYQIGYLDGGCRSEFVRKLAMSRK